MRLINTGIKTDDKTFAILYSVFGQLSDGMWENDDTMNDSYWLHASLSTKDSKAHLVLRVHEYKNTVYNNMTTAEILRFFADRIRDLIKADIADHGYDTSDIDALMRTYNYKSKYIWGYSPKDEKIEITFNDCIAVENQLREQAKKYE